ncbi:sensor histidine kinase [Halopiger xanaduensis]|uniref:histidine kinase n=1 Tax=Halopiger xanaduensis (strain DSM 18323 / JCM 14033 / SH-6) TaxID=797210 RepID=F8DCP2_HALXS|nr:ATP-binding protein [Halopiger xanaduensis]AEH37216.1 integral membrane sensor signal transduction histidine kinase [Halopiger xanaduensis SH-6]
MSSEFDAAFTASESERRYWYRVVPALGVLILVSAIAKATVTLADNGLLLEAALDLVLLGSLGLVTLYIGLWLPNTSIRPAFYPRIVAWVGGGIGVMGIVLALRVLHPGVTVQFTFGTQAVLLAIGSIAGLGIGVHEAQALIRAEALAARNEELKRTERRLEEAVAQLEASNEQLEQFAYAASHDLQEPLRMVTSYLQLIEDRYGDELDEDCTEFIAYAVDGADRMDAMIDGLLEYSRVDTQGGSFEPVDLDAVLEDVCTDLQFMIEESDGTITRESLPTVEGDERQLRQVFQNLLSNAIEYSGDEPPRVHVSAERSAERAAEAEGESGGESRGTGAAWTISVRDEGIGIDPDDADRVFGVFQRLHSMNEHAGSGIGLALCERIVERHGGEIWVDTEPGEGSTFRFTLPSRGDASAASAPDVATRANESKARPERSDRRDD